MNTQLAPVLSRLDHEVVHRYQATLQKRVVWDHQYNNVDRFVGYRALWMKVIIRAAFDWVSYRDSTKLDKLKEAESGYNWLFGKSDSLNSFESICSLIDLPSCKIRKWVMSLTKDHVAKIEHLERESNGMALLEAERRLIEEMPEDG